MQRRWEKLNTATIALPDHRDFRVQASCGVAWYPDDETNFDMLWRFADFAMYKVKHETKGVLKNFDKNIYSVDSILMSGRDALRRMLDEGLVKYFFQPIVSAKTGKIHGYELLMRPQVPELSSPQAALRVAKEQSMLHRVEEMTWIRGLAAARQMQREGRLSPDVKLFINSIASQKNSERMENRVKEAYGDLLSHVVMELTESETSNDSYTAHKIQAIRSMGGKVAIDDYGTGYNSELALMRIDCDYVKLDSSFVRNVDINRDQQSMARGLIYYARSRNIAVLCEGVETVEEMNTLMLIGIDYMQGFLFGRPQEFPCQPEPKAIEALMRGIQKENEE